MSRIKLTSIAVAAALLVAACSSPHKSATVRTPATHAVATPNTSAPASTPAVAAAGLSGTWSGQYSGAYGGTFTLTWHQTGPNLVGHIKLSAPATTLSIHGTLKGSAISFGTVGGVGITYSGTVSGNSMSGTYQVGGGGGGGGPWSGSKAS